VSESLGLTSHKSSCNCTGCGMLRAGATDVSVPADVFLTLKRTGTIKDSDVIGEQTYVLADGSKGEF
jgi:hypothetical protein